MGPGVIGGSVIPLSSWGVIPIYTDDDKKQPPSDDWMCNNCDYVNNPHTAKRCLYCDHYKCIKIGVSPTKSQEFPLDSLFDGIKHAYNTGTLQVCKVTKTNGLLGRVMDIELRIIDKN